jgi:CRP-like cAMP-binding protein
VIDTRSWTPLPAITDGLRTASAAARSSCRLRRVPRHRFHDRAAVGL